jgi:hypothetical protein
MKLPICTFDAKNAVLCPHCEGKVESGVLTQADVDASIILANISKTNKEIENFTLHSCKEFDGNYVLTFAKNDIMGIRQSRTLYRLLQDQFKGKIWLVEADETDKKFIEDTKQNFLHQNHKLEVSFESTFFILTKLFISFSAK